MPLNSTAEADVEPNHPSHDKPSEGVTSIDDDAKNTTGEADTTTPPHAPQEADETTNPGDTMDAILENLTEGIRNQEDIQRDVTARANIALVAQEDERDEKRIERATTNRDRLVNLKQKQLRRLDLINTTSTQKKAIREEIADIDEKVAGLNNDILQSQERIQLRHVEQDDTDKNDGEGSTANRRMPNESQRDFLIRTGKITPFSRMESRPTEGPEGELTDILMEAEEAAELPEVTADQSAEPRSHQYLRKPGFEDISDVSSTTDEDAGPSRPRKKRRVGDGSAITSAEASEGEFILDSARPRKSPGADSAYTPDITDTDFVVGEEEEEEDDDDGIIDIGRAVKKAAKGKAKAKDLIEKVVDDGNEADYQKRLKSWVAKRSRARRMKLGEAADVDDGEEEWFKRSPDAPDHHLPNDLRLPGDIYPALYDYQKTGVQWLGELYASQVGGIVGDEMGLGKTIQVVSFIAALHFSKQLDKPVIVVAPATVLQQWVNEFHRWWPALRVSILHTSGSGMLNVRQESRVEDEDDDVTQTRGGKKEPKAKKAAKRIVDRVVKQGHVLVTTYAGLQTYGDLLVPVQWGYAVLDEGHKIRNPNTTVTIYCKELQTPNRIILSGTPLQNNLIELWSLFDFIYPMRLGTLVNFRNQFEIPIKLGGYANATNLQILTATKCAETLKEAIGPYLIQRLKADVASDLPKKTEQVLFCKLTKPQREAYEEFLKSDEMTSILNRTRQSLYGIDILRKVCNHPDLLEPRLRTRAGYKWGNPNKSGKMQVVKALIMMWKAKGDKILLFSQGVQMLNIIEEFVKSLGGFTYLRMDGGTPIKERQTMVTNFNENPDINIFLLTTKVGGLGVNLTGANRVIIFDPDWNPSTDVQARERAWRLGQKKEVTIYRLMTAGTIEEKIYHRQIFKQFLADKILKDPKQRQTFHMKDLYDLFTLGSSDDSTTETGEIFKGTEVKFKRDTEPGLDYDGTSRMPSQDIPPRNAGSQIANGEAAQNLIAGKVTDPLASTDGEIVPPSRERDEVGNFIGIAKMEDFHDEDEGKTSTEESRIMEGIFARSGVHSVLQHDKIINGKRVVQADRGMIEREAKRIAAEAAAELRRSGEEARNVPIGTVTWTGQVGEAGRPAPTRRRGPGASSVLQGLNERQGPGSALSSPGSSRSGTPATGARGPKGKDFLKLIRDYIRIQGGSVPSQMLVVHFGNMCRTPQQTADFKAMLDEVAEIKRPNGVNARGRWELRDEFK
ncbi:hypothetical protein V502_04629 [Pseudogymnoascus sp. VKM F-4520 (FW-2644)]|nr:hypothetical protein V502_04629 [Pseudogymnoascus sp. VKM F-4520 (FW-2644)]